MTTQSRRVLGKNPRRARTKGASGNSSTPERALEMKERVNKAFNENLEKLRRKHQEKMLPKPEVHDINPMATPAEVQSANPQP